MKRILYIHGLGSGANSHTGLKLAEIFEGEAEVLHPEIPQDPFEAGEFLMEYVRKENIDVVAASSQGGFYALTFLGEMKKVVYNPAINIVRVVEEVIGLGEQEYFSERSNGAKTYILDEEYVRKLKVLKERMVSGITEEAKANTIAVICDDDELLGFNTPSEYTSLFGDKRLVVAHGGHQSTDGNLEGPVAAALRELMEECDD